MRETLSTSADNVRPPRWLALLLAVGVSYALAAQLSFTWFDASSGSATFFPAAGITISALVLVERRSWPVVLAAAAEGGPGPLVAHFSGAVAGTLPCPLVIVPGRLSDEALDRLS